MNDEHARQGLFQRLTFSVSHVARKTQRSLISWAFARFYHEFAWTYDAVAALVSGGQWRDWTLAALPLLHGRVLELACGTGNIQSSPLVRQHFPALVGLDASPQMLALARRKIERAGFVARLLQSDARSLPFPNASFDSLIATFPSEYIADPLTAGEVLRVLRPGGALVVILSAHFTSGGLYHRLIGLAFRATLQRPVWPPPEPEPPRSKLAGQLAQAGLVVEERWIMAPEETALLHTIIARAPAWPPTS